MPMRIWIGNFISRWIPALPKVPISMALQFLGPVRFSSILHSVRSCRNGFGKDGRNRRKELPLCSSFLQGRILDGFMNNCIFGEIRFVKGRLRFKNPNKPEWESRSSAPFPNMIVIFGPAARAAAKGNQK